MRLFLWISLLFGAAACGAAETPAQESMPSEPIAGPLDSSAETEWRNVADEDLLLINTEHGTIAIELNRDFAPGHSARMQEIAAANAYDGATFYRVIDGFVAQGGLQDEELIAANWATIPNENDRDVTDAAFTPLGNDDLFTSLVGHMDGFPAARDEEMGREWLLHCPGAVAMARDTDPDSGGTEFYIVLDAQRYLDRNLTVFGKVIDGMEHVQALKRGDRAVESGVIQPPEKGDTILSAEIAADLPEPERPKYQIINTNHTAFEAAKTAKRVREEEFFYRKPPEVLDVCGFDVPVRQVDP